MISCIIIDDEQHAIEVTSSFCKKIPYLDIIGEFTDPAEAASFIDVHRDNIDLVFLDIEMPRFSGIDFLKAYRFTNVILVTAYTDYALDSYQYGVVDYLLKPFSFDRFSLAVNKVYEKQPKKSNVAENLKEESDFIYLKTDRKKYVKLAYAEICYITGAKNHSVIRTTTEEIVVSLRLKEVEPLLPANRFYRVHKSHIIHIDYFEYLDGDHIKMKTVDRTFPLGNTYKDGFLTLLKQQMFR